MRGVISANHRGHQRSSPEDPSNARHTCARAQRAPCRAASPCLLLLRRRRRAPRRAARGRRAGRSRGSQWTRPTRAVLSTPGRMQTGASAQVRAVLSALARAHGRRPERPSHPRRCPQLRRCRPRRIGRALRLHCRCLIWSTGAAAAAASVLLRSAHVTAARVTAARVTAARVTAYWHGCLRAVRFRRPSWHASTRRARGASSLGRARRARGPRRRFRQSSSGGAAPSVPK